ncbi:MAG: M42 family metallopeptidase [Candidatus Rokubacteria bacterium]|nr:M42 family metallopeptidase [Chloroflexota bacterium]MBM4443637.1 M42 family metallopeptidase [Candidatus Rokubacteria bacterium]
MTAPETTPTGDLEPLLADLTNAFGPTGFEGPVRAIMRRELTPSAAAVETDGLGSLIARFDGTAGRPRVMLAAHMDELGLMVRRITDEGYLKFQPLGGWLDQSLINQRWVVLTATGPIPGVTGIKTVHVMSTEARGRLFRREDMFIDVGARSRQDAEERLGIRPGDPIAPDSRFTPLAGGERYLAKAWDDRVGLAVMVLAVRELRSAASGHPNTVFAVSTVQEEVGLRGAQTSVHAVEPDIGINLESGVAGDYPGISADEAQEQLGAGPSVFLHDGSMLPNLRLRDFVVDVAREANIAIQFDVLTGYGQDGSVIQRSRAGAPSINIAIPTRYLHSHNGIVARHDVLRTARLVAELVRRLDADTVARIRAFD